LIGQNLAAILAEDSWEGVAEFLAVPNPDHPVRTVEHQLNLPNGEERWQQWTVRAIFDDAQQLVAFQSVGNDITQRKQGEAEREHWLAAEREQRLLAETLREVTLALTSQTNHEAVLDEILRQARRVVPYRTANISLLEDNSLRFVRLQGYQSRHTESFLTSQVQRLTDYSLDAEVIESQQPVVINDTHLEERWVVLDKTAWIRSHIVVPICHHKRVLGLLRLDGDRPHQYTPQDAERILPLANAAAIALENARLYEQARQDAETKSVLLNEVNHRVKNNLAAIIGLLYAKHESSKKLNEKVNYQTTMKDLINQMQGLATVHNMLSASRWSPLLLSELIEQVIHSALRALAYNHRASVQVTPSPVRVASDQAHHLALVLNELATNTVKHGVASNQKVKITVSVTIENPLVQVQFKDDGPGYPPEILTLKSNHRSLGFELIGTIVYKNLGGTVAFFNNNGAVTRIKFRPEKTI
jgi:two-component sensor histidine kinase